VQRQPYRVGRFRGNTSAAASAGLVTERGWPRRPVLVKPFWAPGKRGLE
jgi:hypothetical protein